MLQNTKELYGHKLTARDGEIGSVTGFMVDDRSWAIGQLAIEAGKWYSGKEILISPSKVERISYEDSGVFVDLTKAGIQQTAEHEVARPEA